MFDFVILWVRIFRENFKFCVFILCCDGIVIGDITREAVEMVSSVFSGTKFNPISSMITVRSLHGSTRKMYKLTEVTKKIVSLIKDCKLLDNMYKKIKFTYKSMKTSVARFFKRQRSVLRKWIKTQEVNGGRIKDLQDLQLLAEKIDIGTDFMENTQDMVTNTLAFLKARKYINPGVERESPSDLVDHNPLPTTNETVAQFQIGLADEAYVKGDELNAIQVFKWSIIKEYLTDMVESTLLDNVPEATGYRAALLKLLRTCETRLQVSLEQAILETRFAASKSSWDSYYEEAVAVGDAIFNSKQELDKVVGDGKGVKEFNALQMKQIAKKKHIGVELDVLWETMAIKMELVRLNEEYCNSYYYFHLEECQADLRMNPSDSLEDVLVIQNMMLYQAKEKLVEVFPPPQTFTDRSLVFKKVEHCDCLKEIKALRVTESMRTRARAVLLDATYAKTKQCLLNDGFVFSSRLEELAANRKQKDRKAINDLLLRCEDNVVKDLVDHHEFVFKVDADHPLFRYHERVRVDEAKVVLKGAKTESGVVEFSIQTTGLSEDKFDSKCFKFMGGDTWSRTLSYFSKDAELPTSGDERAKRTITDQDYRALVSSLKDIKRKMSNQGEKVYIKS